MKTWLSWSSGKDSAWSYYQLQQQGIEVSGIFTTLNQKQQRVAMHSTREALLEKQAEQLGIPLYKIDIPEPCDNETYQAIMQPFIEQANTEQVTHMAFGDLFLQDIREYRETQLKKPTSPHFSTLGTTHTRLSTPYDSLRTQRLSPASTQNNCLLTLLDVNSIMIS